MDAEEPKLVTLLYDAAEEFEECEMKVLFTNECTPLLFAPHCLKSVSLFVRH